MIPAEVSVLPVARAATQAEQAMEERKDLVRSAEDLEQAERRAVVAEALSSDPFDTSAEAVALRNVREHIEGLDARASLDAELSGKDDALRRKLAVLERQEAEERAKAELLELKAKRSRKEQDQEAAGAKKKKRGPKRTM